MEPDAIPDAIARFLRVEVDSVRELETLLALRDSATTRTAELLAIELRSATRWTEQLLEGLRAKGLVFAEADDGGRPGYRYAPLTAEVADIVDKLAALYATHRATVVGLIYAEADHTCCAVRRRLSHPPRRAGSIAERSWRSK